MNPYELKREFGGRIALHGAVDVQGWLQRATPAEIEARSQPPDGRGRRAAAATSSPPATTSSPTRRWKTSWPCTGRSPSGVRSCVGQVANLPSCRQIGNLPHVSLVPWLSRHYDPRMTASLPETILQFGAGKFLRCFADLFAHEANEGAEPAGRVVVVQSTGNACAGRSTAQDGRYRVAIRGLMAGRARGPRGRGRQYQPGRGRGGAVGGSVGRGPRNRCERSCRTRRKRATRWTTPTGLKTIRRGRFRPSCSACCRSGIGPGCPGSRCSRANCTTAMRNGSWRWCWSRRSGGEWTMAASNGCATRVSGATRWSIGSSRPQRPAIRWRRPIRCSPWPSRSRCG